MHTAYALEASDFAVERGGAVQPLASLWPGYDADEDRLAVLLNEPLDAVGCANLVVATTVLFYDHLRTVEGENGFFRYPDTFLVGVGTQPGEFRKLDVWPPHKLVRAPPDRPEPLLEALADRRITLLAVPEEGLPTRGPAMLSTWNTLARTVRRVMTYAPRSGRVRQGDLTLVGNAIVEDYVEHALEATEGVSAEVRAAVREGRRACHREPGGAAEVYGVLGGLDVAAPRLGITEILAAGQQVT